MIKDTDALRAMRNFDDENCDHICLDTDNSLIKREGRWWWKRKEAYFDLPVQRVWCSYLMDNFFIFFKGFGYVAIEVYTT